MGYYTAKCESCGKEFETIGELCCLTCNMLPPAKGGLDEVIVPETGETRLDNIGNALALNSLLRDPIDIVCTNAELSELISRVKNAERLLESAAVQLREVSKRATGGEWYVAETADGRVFVRSREGGVDHAICECFGGTGPRPFDARGIVSTMNTVRAFLRETEA